MTIIFIFLLGSVNQKTLLTSISASRRMSKNSTYNTRIQNEDPFRQKLIVENIQKGNVCLPVKETVIPLRKLKS